MISNRKFGVEIEMYGLSPVQILSVFNNLDISCRYENYNHRTRNHWKITTDGSINGSNPHELVSPPLQGEEGLEEVKKIANAIRGAGGRINASCGLHVHVEASGLNSLELANTVIRYSKFENEIDMLMPYSRRGDRNSYCYSVQGLGTQMSLQLRQISRLSNNIFIRNFLGGDRFRKVNLVSYLRHGTIEFRQHSGTLDGTKIINWIQFCVNFVEQSKIETTEEQRRQQTENQNSDMTPTMQNIIYVFENGREASRTRGWTRDNLAYYAHCSPASISRIISRLRTNGYNIEYNRSLGTYLYRGITNDENHLDNSILISENPDDSWKFGLEQNIIAYYGRRRRALNNRTSVRSR